MHGKPALGCCALLICCASLAQERAAELATPPGEARHFIIESVGGKHGDSWSWIAADGTRMGRESMDLRGQLWDSDYTATSGPDGMPSSLTIRGFAPEGDAAETFSIANGIAHWKSPVDAGTARSPEKAFYLAEGGPIDTSGWLLERLLASSDRSLDLLPGGRAHATALGSLDVGDSASTRQTINLWGVSGLDTAPTPMWADAQGKFFAVTDSLGWLPAEYAGEQQHLLQAQTAAIALQTAALAKTLVEVPTAPVAFVDVRLFDADRVRFVLHQTVIIDKGIITAVGPAATVKAPAGAKLIPSRGMTLVPGLWDSHMHVQNDFTGIQELSLGVTSVRDPGNVNTLTLDRRVRAAAGQLLFPHVYPSALIDGHGPYTAQFGSVAASQVEALELVDRAKAEGFTAIKFYGTFNPDWLPATIAEAHRLGLHVHGHVPAGIRPLDAINDGYDEITHINFIMMQAMPDSVVDVSNSAARFEGPGRYAREVNLNAPPIKTLIATMASEHIYSDPTMTAFEAIYVPEAGELSPAYAPFVGTLPPAVERAFRSSGFAVPKDLTRADYRASWAKMVALLTRMHKAKIQIVAGTDGSGIELVRELEIYVKAGFTTAEALAAATIVPARLVGMEEHTGSIKVGKAADLALVAGDPSMNIKVLRQTRVVMLDGQLLDADALRQAAGYSGRPK
jgi:imidazolonepropionase-like amidohydrolase